MCVVYDVRFFLEPGQRMSIWETDNSSSSSVYSLAMF
jgi:hypothetical protein